MTFLNPALLAGLFAVGLPILIHLLSKPRLRRLPWAATKFLLASVQKNRRRVQAEDILLLILRALIVLILALIFARPAFMVNAGPQLGGLAAPAVIILDNSMSMGQSDGVRTRFDQAKTMADDLLSRLATGSTCALFLSSEQVSAVIPKPTEDLAVVRRFIDSAPLTDGSSDLYPALKQAVDLLKASPGSHREIFVLTDSQMPAWKELGKIRELQEKNAGDIKMNFLIVGDHGENNLAISSLQPGGAVAAVNQPLRCAIAVNNWGRDPVDNITVKLAADDAAPQDQAIIDHLAPGASKMVTLVARFREPGYHSLTASIPGDRLPADNSRSTALLVLDRIGALVVEGNSNRQQGPRDGFFLSHALVPVTPDQAAQYYVKVAMAHPNDLESSTIQQNAIIFLSNVGQLTPRSIQNLKEFVTRGGALVVFPGPATDPTIYNSEAGLGGLLPAKLGPLSDPPDKKFLTWQSHNYEHPVVTLWNQDDSGTLGTIRTMKYFPLTLNGKGDAASTPQVVVKYNDGEPAVVEQSLGKGKVILFSSTATMAWTTLPVHPAFVPLLYRIISYATSQSGAGLNLTCGQTFSLPIDSEYGGKEFSVLRPNEKKRRIVGEIESGEQNAFLRYGDTSLSGTYQLFTGDDVKPRAVFAVQSDPDESNLAQQPQADLAPLLNPPATTGAKPEQDAAPVSTRRVPGRELWFPLSVLALVLAFVEMTLSHRFSRSK